MKLTRFLNRAGLALIAGTMVANSTMASEARKNFSIPSSPLGTALQLYAVQSGDQIALPSDLAASARSGGARGLLTNEAALNRILAGTDIQAVRSAQGIVGFRKLADAPTPPPVPTPAKEEEELSEIDEIVVTAQRRSENQQRVPISVAVVSGTALESQAIRTLEDLAPRLSNVRIAQAPASDQIHIRGTGSGYGNGFEQSVATFVDGFYRNRSRASRVALFDIDRVEVLKGPQTLFFGANAIAGALNITTRKPGRVLEGNASALYSPSDGEYNVESGISAPVTDTLSVRLAGRWSGMSGYIKSDTGLPDAPHLDDKQGRISAVWTASDRLEVSARFDIARLRDRGTFAYELLNCPPTNLPIGNLCQRTIALNGSVEDKLDWHSGALANGFSDLNLEEGVVTGKLDLGGVTLISTTGYLHQRSYVSASASPYPVLSPIGTKVYLNLIAPENFNQISQELRLQSSGDGPISYMVGGYYEHGKLDLPFFIAYYFAPFGAAAAPTYGPTSPIALQGLTNQTSETWSGFGSLSYDIGDRLTASVGLRYTDVRKTATRAFQFGLGQPDGQPDGFVPGPASVQPVLSAILGNSLAPFPTGVRHESALMPSANLRYQLSPDVMVYASYTHGFKAGGFSGQTPDEFGPETADAYEAGLKAMWFDRRLTTNIAIYRNEFSNLQESQSTTTATGAPITIVGNSAASLAQGVELNLAWRVTPRLSFNIDGAYTDSHYVDFRNAPCNPVAANGNPACVADQSGFTRAFAPKWTGGFGADYKAPLTNDIEARFGGLVYFSSNFYQQSTIYSLVRQPSYAKLDLRTAIGPDDRRWEVAVIGKNLTNKATASFRNYAPGSLGSNVALADRPRSIAVQLSTKW